MKKVSNLIFVLIFLILSCAVICLNKVKDPYGIFEIISYPDFRMQDINREFLYTAINLTKKYKYDYVMVSGSNGGWSISPNVFQKYTNGKKIFYLNPNGISPYELHDLLKYFLKLHPETKNVLVSLEANTYITCRNKYSIPQKPANIIQDFLNLYFSIDAAKLSINILISEIKNKYFIKHNASDSLKQDNETSGLLPKYINKLQRDIYSETCEYDNLEGFKKIYNLIKENNLNAIYFIPPNNVLYYAYLQYHGYFDATLTLKKEMAEFVSFYDMAFVNHYTVQPIKYLFTDYYHCSCEFLSKKIIDTIINNKTDKNFAVFITKDNADEIVKKQKKDLSDYIAKNKQYVEAFIYAPYDPLKNDTYREKYYFTEEYINAMPDEIRKLYEENRTD